MPAKNDSALLVARAPGLFNVVGGAWPIVWLRSFEWVFGPKEEDWLQKTSGALFMSTGIAQLMTEDSPESIRFARRVGIGVALTYLTIDLIYVPKGRLRKTYLLDALMEAGWLYAWAKAERRSPH
jgi:hypothetical protein